MTVYFSLALFAIALGASILGGILGMASGVFIVPMLIACGIDIRTALAKFDIEATLAIKSLLDRGVIAGELELVLPLELQ